MTKQINVRLSKSFLALIDELKKIYDTNSTTDIIQFSILAACHEFDLDIEEIINNAYKVSKVD